MQNIDFGTRSLLNTTAYCGQATTVRWSWSSCSAEYGLPPESRSFAAAQYSMKSLTICLNSSAEEDRAPYAALHETVRFSRSGNRCESGTEEGGWQ